MHKLSSLHKTVYWDRTYIVSMDSAETKDVVMQKIMKQGLSKQGANRRKNLLLSRDFIQIDSIS